MNNADAGFGIALLVAGAFIFGFAVGDFVQYTAPVKETAECKTYREHAEFYAGVIAHLLNEKSVILGETTAVSCKARDWRKS